MVHIGSVVHQCTKLEIQSFIHGFTEPQPRLGQVCGIDLHATQVKVIQAVFPQGMFEALLRALSRNLAHQAGDLGCPPVEQRFDDMHTQEAVGTRDNHLMNITHSADRQCSQLKVRVRIPQRLSTEGSGRSAVTVDQAGECQHGRCFDKTIDGNTAPKAFTNAQQQARQQDRVSSEIEKAFISRDVVWRQFQQLAP